MINANKQIPQEKEIYIYTNLTLFKREVCVEVNITTPAVQRMIF